MQRELSNSELSLRKQGNKHAIAIALFSIITLWFTSPLVFHLNASVISVAKDGDVPQYLWNAWSLKKSLTAHQDYLYTNKIFYPVGGSLVMHTYTPLMSSFSLLFENTYLGINIFILLNYLLSAFGAYLLCMNLTKCFIPALLTGIAFAFSAYKISHLPEHYNLILTAPIPFYLLFFFKAFHFEYGRFIPYVKHKPSVFFAFVMGFIALLSDYYVVFFLLYFSGVWCLFYKVWPVWLSWKTRTRWTFMIALFAISHIVSQRLYKSGIEDNGGIFWGGDLLSYFIPTQGSSFWNREWFVPFLSEKYLSKDNIEFELFIGYGLIIASFSILWVAIKRRLPENSYPWLFVMVVFIMITMPAITINGSIKLLYLPTSFIQYIPFINNIRCPTRIHMMLFIILPMAITYVWYSISDIAWWNKYRTAAMSLLLVFTLLEFIPEKLPLINVTTVPEVLKEIKKSSVDVLLPVPLGVSSGSVLAGRVDTYLLFAQTVHEKATLGGYISRVEKKVFAFYQQDSVCAAILKCSADPDYIPAAATVEEKEKFFAVFKANGILILPEYRNTNAERYVLSLLTEKKYSMTDKDQYLFIDFSK